MSRIPRSLALAALLSAGAVHAQFCPGVTPWVFSDVPAGDPFCGYITWMAQKGVTLGCRELDPLHREYCPKDFVTREQMAAFMRRLDTAEFPTTCTTGQVLKWSGTAWACANDATGGSGSGGTVTSIAAGTGITAVPNPITTTGSINVATSYRLPQGCANNQVPKWVGGAWTCANDADTNSGGTVTAVTAGTGLTGGTINTTGTISVAPGYLLPQSCANGQVAKSNGAGGWTCANDVTGGVGTVTSLSAGSGIVLTPSPVVTAGTIAVDPAYVQRRVSASCAVGSSIRAIAADGTVTCETDTGAANAFVQGGNAFGTTATLGTTDNTQLHLIVNDSAVMRYFPHTISPKVIGGSAANEVWVAARGATIGGGGTTSGSDPDLIGWRNIVTDAYGTVGGGTYNQAGDGAGTALDAPYATVAGGADNEAGGAATVGGGVGNRATGVLSTVAGGTVNHAVEYGSAVGGGASNYAIGQSAVVPGGQSNRAEGAYSVAMGYRAKALGRGSFSFADSNDFDFSSTSVNVFRVRATGGVRFVTDIDAAGATVWSCLATAGSGWACSSDARQKQNLERLDGRDVLERLASLPVYAWNPKDRNAHVRHFGPTAQDFRAAFGLGDDDTLIGTQDADGVALAAIQGLHALVKERDATIARQEELLRAVQSELDELRAAVRHLLGRSVPR